MSEQAEQKAEKPKRERKPKEAIIVAPEPDVRLGSLAIQNPEELVRQAASLATALAEIINQQKLYSIIRNKRGEANKYVKCEGWTTMGAMLGVVPVEDYCRPLPNGNGFEAKINLIRGKDGGLVGSASAECTHDEANWKARDSYSLRSMALTRATSKAFRLSFSWIIKLAGFEVTPAEEMMAEEDASVTRQQVEAEVERQKHGETPQNAPQTHQEAARQPNGAARALFIAHPPAFENKYAFVTGLEAVKAYGLKSYIERDAKGLWIDVDKGWRVPIECVAELTRVAMGLECPVHVQTPKNRV